MVVLSPRRSIAPRRIGRRVFPSRNSASTPCITLRCCERHGMTSAPSPTPHPRICSGRSFCCRNFNSSDDMTPHAQTRREFLQKLSAASLAALATGAPRRVFAAGAKPKASADTVILLWMAGGMAHSETFDPKQFAPFTPGADVASLLSTFEPRPTALDGVLFSEGLEEIGRVMDRGTLIRSHVVADLGKILHSRHQFHWHTSYEPPQTVAAPHLGAWVAKELGPRNPVVPPFIVVGQRFDRGEKEELKAFHTAGFLGNEFGPFIIEEPTAALDTVRPPAGMTPERFEARQALYREMLKTSGFAGKASDYQQESMLR